MPASCGSGGRCRSGPGSAGMTAVIASGKPFSPSTTAIRMSSTPRLRSSFITRSQNFAPSVCSIHRPRISLWPVGADAEREVDRLVAHRALVADLHPQRVEEHQRIERLERPVLPFGHLVQDGVGHRADQVGRDVDAIELAQVALDLADASCHGRTARSSCRRSRGSGGDTWRSAAARSSPAGRAAPRAPACRCRSAPSCGCGRYDGCGHL